MKILIKASVLLFSVYSLEAFAAKCEEVRMGLDIGSGSTKMMVAKVDTCKRKIIEVLLSDARQISFNEDLAKSSDDKLSQEMIDTGLSKMQELVTEAQKFKPKKSYGVATSVFRKASNGSEVIKSYSRKLKIKLEVISHHEEAVLGYISAMSMIDDNAKKGRDVVTWDIGGGSMQILYLNDKKQPESYLGDLASVTFKNMIVEVLKLEDPDKVTTPNPIGKYRPQAIALARAYAKIHVPAHIKKKIKESMVVGLGGVHGISIKNQIGTKEKYTLSELDKTGIQRVLKSDSDLVGDFKTTDVSNLLLVQGFMEALDVSTVNVVEANLLQGVVLSN